MEASTSNDRRAAHHIGVYCNGTTMMSFKDMTFCSNSKACGNTKCDRRFSEQDSIEADAWWGDEAGGGPPIAMSNFQTHSCGFVPLEELICRSRTHGQGIPLPSHPLSEATSISLKLTTGRKTTGKEST